MIDALIYGPTPNANIENDSNAPPLIAFHNSKNPKSFVNALVPGTVIEVPNVNINNTNNVNNKSNIKVLESDKYIFSISDTNEKDFKKFDLNVDILKDYFSIIK